MDLLTAATHLASALFASAATVGAAWVQERRRRRTEPTLPYRAPLPSLPHVPARPRVLVVEDDMASARAAARLLTQDGYEVDVAHTADDARHLAALAPYRVVLGDLLLGGGGVEDGEALLAELRERQRLRIVVYSGGSPEMLAVVRRELAPDAVVEKPDTDEMLAAVRAAVSD